MVNIVSLLWRICCWVNSKNLIFKFLFRQCKLNAVDQVKDVKQMHRAKKTRWLFISMRRMPIYTEKNQNQIQIVYLVAYDNCNYWFKDLSFLIKNQNPFRLIPDIQRRNSKRIKIKIVKWFFLSILNLFFNEKRTTREKRSKTVRWNSELNWQKSEMSSTIVFIQNTGNDWC